MEHEPYKILLIEDNQSDIDLIDIQLKKLDLKFEIEVAGTKKDFKEYLREKTADLILSDYNLPNFNGLEALEYVRELNYKVPFILISGYIGEEKAVDVMRKGASDYVLKDNLERLGPAVKRELFHFREQQETESERDEAIQKLQERIKEQKCLYNISSLDEQSLTIPELIYKALNYLPFGFQHPEIAAISIDFDGETYQTDHFVNNKNTLTCTSNETGKAPLTVSVSYLQEKSGLNERPFLKEEHHLVKSVAENLALKINRILTQNELREKNDLLEKAYNLAQIGNWELDLETSELTWSQKTKEIHELPEDFEPTQEKLEKLYKKSEHWPAIERSIERIIQDGEPFDHEVRIITAKGNERWIRVMGQPEFKDGEVIRVYGSMQNIDQRKRAEEELQRSE